MVGALVSRTPGSDGADSRAGFPVKWKVDNMTNMTARYALGFVLLAGAAGAADAPPPLDVRPGMWEATTTSETTGVPPIPPEILARMTPEQKAMLEARMKQGVSPGKTTVRKHCITKEEINKGLTFGDDHGSCQRTVVSGSSSKQEIRIECSNSGIKATGTIRIEAIDPEHVKFSVQVTSGDGAHSMKINTAGNSKWVSAPCTSDEKK